MEPKVSGAACWGTGCHGRKLRRTSRQTKQSCGGSTRAAVLIDCIGVGFRQACVGRSWASAARAGPTRAAVCWCGGLAGPSLGVAQASLRHARQASDTPDMKRVGPEACLSQLSRLLVGLGRRLAPHRGLGMGGWASSQPGVGGLAWLGLLGCDNMGEGGARNLGGVGETSEDSLWKKRSERPCPWGGGESAALTFETCPCSPSK